MRSSESMCIFIGGEKKKSSFNPKTCLGMVVNINRYCFMLVRLSTTLNYHCILVQDVWEVKEKIAIFNLLINQLMTNNVVVLRLEYKQLRYPWSVLFYELFIGILFSTLLPGHPQGGGLLRRALPDFPALRCILESRLVLWRETLTERSTWRSKLSRTNYTKKNSNNSRRTTARFKRLGCWLLCRLKLLINNFSCSIIRVWCCSMYLLVEFLSCLSFFVHVQGADNPTLYSFYRYWSARTWRSMK